ncbi:hypothetical protein ACKVWC_011500 [Pyricularia oryzae]
MENGRIGHMVPTQPTQEEAAEQLLNAREIEAFSDTELAKHLWENSRCVTVQDPENISESFLERLREMVRSHNVPHSAVVDLDGVNAKLLATEPKGREVSPASSDRATEILDDMEDGEVSSHRDLVRAGGRPAYPIQLLDQVWEILGHTETFFHSFASVNTNGTTLLFLNGKSQNGISSEPGRRMLGPAGSARAERLKPPSNSSKALVLATAAWPPMSTCLTPSELEKGIVRLNSSSWDAASETPERVKLRLNGIRRYTCSSMSLRWAENALERDAAELSWALRQLPLVQAETEEHQHRKELDTKQATKYGPIQKNTRSMAEAQKTSDSLRRSPRIAAKQAQKAAMANLPTIPERQQTDSIPRKRFRQTNAPTVFQEEASDNTSGRRRNQARPADSVREPEQDVAPQKRRKV